MKSFLTMDNIVNHCSLNLSVLPTIKLRLTKLRSETDSACVISHLDLWFSEVRIAFVYWLTSINTKLSTLCYVTFLLIIISYETKLILKMGEIFEEQFKAVSSKWNLEIKARFKSWRIDFFRIFKLDLSFHIDS